MPHLPWFGQDFTRLKRPSMARFKRKNMYYKITCFLIVFTFVFAKDPVDKASVYLQKSMMGNYLIRSEKKIKLKPTYHILKKEIGVSPLALKELEAFKKVSVKRWSSYWIGMTFSGTGTYFLSFPRNTTDRILGGTFIVSSIIMLIPFVIYSAKADSHLTKAVWQYNRFILTPEYAKLSRSIKNKASGVMLGYQYSRKF